MAIEDISRLSCPSLSPELLASAIERMRRGEVFIQPGYDGEYGVIRTFKPGTIASVKTKASGEELFDDTRPLVTGKSVGKAPANRNPGVRQAAQKKNISKQDNTNNAPRPFSLNEDQQAAISSKASRALIIAGPGTGKTALLAVKIGSLIREGVDSDSILALSFTVKAAAELRERIEVQNVPRVSTFHSLCASILRKQYEEAYLPADFGILGDTERTELLTKLCAYAKRGTGSRQNVSPRRLSEYIEERKRFLLLPGENVDELKRILPSSLISLIPDKVQNTQDSSFEPLYEEYRNQLKAGGLVDYDGLIAGTVRLFALREDILKTYRSKFRYIFVDEYQDINFAQYALIQLLAPAKKDTPSLWVIGDPNQAIYGFRGSNKAFIDRFQQDYPKAACFTLQKSFRCSQTIIEAAGCLTKTRLEGVKAETVNEKIGSYTVPVSLFRREYRTEKSEAEGIARTISSLLGGTSFFALDSGAAASLEGHIGQTDLSQGYLSPEDCAVLVRTTALAEPITKALKDHGIPFDEAESPWWDDESVKQVLASLKEQNPAVSGIVTPNLLSIEDQILSAWKTLNKEKTISPKRKDAAIPENITRLITLANIFGTVQALLDGLSTGQNAGGLGISSAGVSHGVKVMTIHASKGLEFDHVFVAGLEEGMLPFTLYEEKPDEENLSEERRLLYVAMTRARKGLWLSYAASRYYRGHVLKAPPSRFISEIGSLVPLLKEEKTVKRDSQMSLF
jgi:superfamily I DNA/RNA helicase